MGKHNIWIQQFSLKIHWVIRINEREFTLLPQDPWRLRVPQARRPAASPEARCHAEDTQGKGPEFQSYRRSRAPAVQTQWLCFTRTTKGAKDCLGEEKAMVKVDIYNYRDMKKAESGSCLSVPETGSSETSGGHAGVSPAGENAS